MAPADAAPGQQDLVPTRVPGVVLHGPMAGSGYAQPPCLVRRGDGQAIQLTPLVYGVLSAVDGRRTWDEVAAAVSTDVQRPVTAADVRHLAEHRLRPAGLLRLADGSEPASDRAKPLLGLRFRVAISRPAATNRIAAVFAWLFSPAVMVPVLLAFAASTWWVLADQGVGGAIDAALAQPGMVLALVAATVLSAAFHEIGHAAACRHSGAQPGAMGAGLYLVWPVFYTDVTDSYRLGRAGRLRVDLGGLYFNAVFSVAAVGLWWLTRVDALLLVVPIQLVQMLRQLIPLVRFDGYHILADITGVPDLFARVRPTVLRLLGRPDLSAPALKPWATAVVGVWVLLVVPALLALVILTVWHLPAIAQSAGQGIAEQWGALVVNLDGGQQVRAALGVVAIFTIALVPLGIVAVLSRLTLRMTRGFMAVTEDRWPVRLAGVALVVMLVASMGPTWLPDGPVAPRMVADRAPTVEPVVASGDEVAVAPPASPAGRPVPAAVRAATRASTTTAYAMASTGSTGSTRGGAATQPQLVVASVGDEWPFPFAPPADARPGDNVVVAVNTIDGGALFEMTSHLAWVTQGTMADPRNVAVAAASCTGCTTMAVAFQVVFAIGQVDAAPVNESVAVNHECATCATDAVAVQLMVTLEEEPTAEMLAAIEQLWAQVDLLEQQLEGQSTAVIHAELGRVRDEIVHAVSTGGAAVVAGDDEWLAEGEGQDDDLAVTDRPFQRRDGSPAALVAESPYQRSSAPDDEADDEVVDSGAGQLVDDETVVDAEDAEVAVSADGVFVPKAGDATADAVVGPLDTTGDTTTGTPLDLARTSTTPVEPQPVEPQPVEPQPAEPQPASDPDTTSEAAILTVVPEPTTSGRRRRASPRPTGTRPAPTDRD